MAKHLFRTEKRTIPVGNHTIRLLILHPLEGRNEKVPGVLWVHGGGYQSGSAKDIFATRALSLVVKYGAVLVAPNYRLSRKHPYPAALHDCSRKQVLPLKHVAVLLSGILILRFHAG